MQLAAFVPAVAGMEEGEAQIVGRGKVAPGPVQVTSNCEGEYDGIVQLEVMGGLRRRPRMSCTTRRYSEKSRVDDDAAAAAAVAGSRRRKDKGRGSTSEAHAVGKEVEFPEWPVEGQTTDDKVLAAGRLDPTQMRDCGKVPPAAWACSELEPGTDTNFRGAGWKRQGFGLRTPSSRCALIGRPVGALDSGQMLPESRPGEYLCTDCSKPCTSGYNDWTYGRSVKSRTPASLFASSGRFRQNYHPSFQACNSQ